MKRQRMLIGLTMATASAALVGCGSSKTTSSAKAVPVKGGTAVVAMTPQGSPNWFFPEVSASTYTEINSQIQELMYKPLVMFNKHNQPDYQISIASGIHYNAKGTQYTISLSHKYQWSNGHPVTAQDVVYAWDIMKAASNPKAPWLYGGSGSGGVPTAWAKVVASGNSTVVVTLAHSANPQWFIHNGLSQITPIPKSVWDKYPTNMTKELKFIQSVSNSPNNPVYQVVDGPFRFSKMVPNRYWDLVPNPHYGGHKARIAKLEFQYETSASAEFAALKTGQVNVGYLPPSMWSARHQLTQDTLSSSYLFGMNYLVPNFNKKSVSGAFSHLYVRQALEMGINQKAIVNSLYHGFGVPMTGPIPSKPQTAFYDKALAKPL